MPAKNTKRAASPKRGAGTPKKKARVDPVFAGIITTLQGADDLSERCREMLIAMTSPCLSTPKSERHSLQQLGVTMIDEKLQDHKQKLVAAVTVAQEELSKLEGSKETLVKNLEAAKSTLEEKKTAFLSLHKVREDAKEAVKVAEKALAQAKSAQAAGDANHASLTISKAEIETAFLEHFKAPMDANEAPKHSALKPFIKNLGLEDSLSSALPSSCAKPKDQRGSFDELVITELGKALEARIASLTKSIADEAAGVAERSANIVAAQAVVEEKTAAEKSAAANLEAAAAEQHSAEAVLTAASEEWTNFEPRVQEATGIRDGHESTRVEFEDGPLKDFVNLRDKEAPVPAAVEEEAATAGA